MPIREYRCQECGYKFETLVLPGEDESALTCPECHATAIKRCMSVFAGRVAEGNGGAKTSKSVGSGCASCAGGTCSTCH